MPERVASYENSLLSPATDMIKSVDEISRVYGCRGIRECSRMEGIAIEDCMLLVPRSWVERVDMIDVVEAKERKSIDGENPLARPNFPHDRQF